MHPSAEGCALTADATQLSVMCMLLCRGSPQAALTLKLCCSYMSLELLLQIHVSFCMLQAAGKSLPHFLTGAANNLAISSIIAQPAVLHVLIHNLLDHLRLIVLHV